jgi:hypothetical protein
MHVDQDELKYFGPEWSGKLKELGGSIDKEWWSDHIVSEPPLSSLPLDLDRLTHLASITTLDRQFTVTPYARRASP